MISFKLLDAKTYSEILDLLSANFAEDELEYAREITSSFLPLSEEDEDVEVGICLAHGCVLVRIFDMGRYSFVYPISVSEAADTGLALGEVRAYAVREEVPLVLTDIPREEVSVLLTAARHLTIDSSDVDGEFYRAELMQECMLVEDVPSVSDGELELREISENDIPSMARLARSEEVNRYWGYDFREDAPNASDEYFYDCAMSDASRGQALTLAVRYGDEYIGEVVLHAFDYLGGAELGIRLLPEWQGRGLGARALELAFDVARSIGLVRVWGSVMRENERSVSMLKKYMDVRSDGDVMRFVLELN